MFCLVCLFSFVNSFVCLFILIGTAMKIHLSEKTKHILEEFQCFQTVLRGRVELKVNLILYYVSCSISRMIPRYTDETDIDKTDSRIIKQLPLMIKLSAGFESVQRCD